jgi:hypothetical protein
LTGNSGFEVNVKDSLISLKEQQEICKKYNLPETAPEDMVAVALSSIGKMPISGTRIKLSPDENVSWFIHCGDYSDADDFYQPMHTEHVGEILPLVVKYLRLPPGTRFAVDADGFEDVWTVA